MAGGGMPSGDDSFEDEEGAGFTEPNIVPLVDIMLVLLVILMAGSSAIVQAGGSSDALGNGFRVNLPSATGDKSMSSVSNELVVTILESGEIVVGDSEVSPQELETFLNQQASEGSERLVLVQADQNAVHSRVVEVMEIARKSGLSNLAIATRGAELEE